MSLIVLAVVAVSDEGFLDGWTKSELRRARDSSSLRFDSLLVIVMDAIFPVSLRDCCCCRCSRMLPLCPEVDVMCV